MSWSLASKETAPSLQIRRMAIPLHEEADQVPIRIGDEGMAVCVNYIHSSDKTKGFYCDGKPCFEVWLRIRNRIEREVYYCTYTRSEFEPSEFSESTCPKNGNKYTFKPKFNW